MEDYTYSFGDSPIVLGSHMLEICPSITTEKPSLQVHPLGIGGKEDPVHTSYSRALTFEHLEDFAEIAGIELLRIGKDTTIEQFRKELRWNETSYWMTGTSGH
jgi:L-arabinose isomerase